MKKIDNINELATSILKKALNVLKYIAVISVSFFVGGIIIQSIRYPNLNLQTNNTNQEIGNVIVEYNKLNEDIDALQAEIEKLKKDEEEKNNKVNELKGKLNSYN